MSLTAVSCSVSIHTHHPSRAGSACRPVIPDRFEKTKESPLIETETDREGAIREAALSGRRRSSSARLAICGVGALALGLVFWIVRDSLSLGALASHEA